MTVRSDERTSVGSAIPAAELPSLTIRVNRPTTIIRTLAPAIDGPEAHPMGEHHGVLVQAGPASFPLCSVHPRGVAWRGGRAGGLAGIQHFTRPGQLFVLHQVSLLFRRQHLQ